MSNYSGRHRPPTRAERRSLERRSSLPKSLTPAYALPTAAAVALALTAAGATAAQSSSGGGLGTAAFSGGGAAESAATLLDDADVTESARTQVAADSRDSSGLTERRQEASATAAQEQGREDRGERAGRSQSRQERADAKKERSSSAATTSSDSDEDEDKDAEDESSSGWVKPLDNAVFTSPYGHRWGRLHAGQDYAADVGTPLKSMGTGEVIGAGPMAGYGKYIDIRYTDGTVSRYGHIDSFSASVGQEVSPGDVVAKSGNTGQSTGPHLHLEIRPGGGEPIDPAGWLAERGID